MRLFILLLLLSKNKIFITACLCLYNSRLHDFQTHFLVKIYSFRR